MDREAVTAVDRLVQPGLEGDLRRLPRIRANRREHLPFRTGIIAAAAVGVAAVAARLAGRAAVRAAAGLVGEALLREEILLAGRPDEAHPTVPTGEGLIH